MKIDPCAVCGTHFNNIFEMVDHLAEDEESPEFDPMLILPNGYKLLVGTLLRIIHENASKPRQVREIVEGAYTTLYLAEKQPHAMRESMNDTIVSNHMRNIDRDLKRLLGDKNDD